MANNWKLIKLSDVADIIGGGTPPTKNEEYYGGDIPWITPKDLSSHKFRYIEKGERNITEIGLSKSSAKLLPAKTILFSSRAPIGYVAIAKNTLSTNQGFKSLILKEGHDPDFYFYLLKSNVSVFEQKATGSTFKEVSGKAVKETEFYVPDTIVQKKVGSYLKAIDDKIELNQQTNQTLEKMAQTLFKSWFVDFDPVFDNALAKADFNLEALPSTWPDALVKRATSRLQVLQDNPTLQAKLTQHHLAVTENNTAPTQVSQAENTHQHFPSEFETTDEPSIGINGWIPKGWGKSQLSDITTELRRGISPKYIEEGGVQVINQKCIRNHEINFTPCRRNNSELRNTSGRELVVGDLLINSTGVGTLGRMAQVQYLDEKTVVDSHVTVVRSRPEIYPVYSFAQMMLSMEDKIEALGHGSTGQTELSRKTVSEQWVVVPKTKALVNLNSQLISISEKIVLNSRQNIELTKLRDTLLPKLISGELQIPDLEAVNG